jgi:hypothetical protein
MNNPFCGLKSDEFVSLDSGAELLETSMLLRKPARNIWKFYNEPCLSGLYLGDFKPHRKRYHCPWFKITVLWDMTPCNLVELYQTAWRHIPNHSNLHRHRRVKLKSHKYLLSFTDSCYFTTPLQLQRLSGIDWDGRMMMNMNYSWVKTYILRVYVYFYIWF